MDIQWLTEWDDDISFCPSQLTRQYQDPFLNQAWTLHCRWRYADPWTFSTFPTPVYCSECGRQTVETDGPDIRLAIEMANPPGENDLIQTVHKYAKKALQKFLEERKKNSEVHESFTMPSFEPVSLREDEDLAGLSIGFEEK